MSYATDILNDVRRRIAPDDFALNEARERRDAVLKYAKRFPGVRGEYLSGSVAHRTANEVKDADCGVILDRRYYPELGPDGNNVGSYDTVDDMRGYLRDDSGLAEEYPNARFEVQDRSILIRFNEPFYDSHGTELDPSVDLILALERKHAPGLWIPKAMKSTSPGWDASHPEKHTDLFLPSDLSLRRTRVWTTRLTKAWNDFGNWTFSSFNLASLAYWGLERPAPPDQALYDFFAYAAKDFVEHRTEDPAGVSDRIKLPDGVTLDQASGRMARARDRAEEALEATTEDDARWALHRLFPSHVDAPLGDEAASLANKLRQGAAPGIGAGKLAVGSGIERHITRTRSYGDP